MSFNSYVFIHRRASRQGGFTLIEILISLLVLAIGLLGLAALQAFGLRNGQTAYFRTVATFHAYDLSDRMRTNLATANTGGYEWDPDDTPTVTDCTSNTCTAAQIATHDLAEWANAIDATLPGGKGQSDRATSGVYTITVMWDDQRKGVTGTNCGGDPDVDLTCFSMEVRP